MKGYLNSLEAAEFLGINVDTLRNWRTSGIGPSYVKFNPRCVAYPRSDLQAFKATYKKGKHRKRGRAVILDPRS